jgi:Flp pilus assembly pilin Flp
MSGLTAGLIIGGASLVGGVVSSIFGASSASKANDLAEKNMQNAE